MAKLYGKSIDVPPSGCLHKIMDINYLYAKKWDANYIP
jgi:hypothetical protein